MLPIVLVLFIATSALAGPYVNIQQVSQNAVLGPADSSFLARALDTFSGGDKSVFNLNLEQTLKEANNVQSFGQAVAVLGSLSTGRPGDSCAASSYIDAYVSGQPGAIRQALRNYVQDVVNGIDNIVTLVTNREAARFSTGSRGGCSGEGRVYQFDAAWDKVLASASPSQLSTIEQEYCVAKRMYNAVNARTNNVSAQVTASALPPTVQVFSFASGALSNLVQALASGGNPAQAAGAAKQALISGISRVSL